MNDFDIIYNDILNYMNAGNHSDKEIYEFMVTDLMKVANLSREVAIERINKACKEMGIIIPN